MTTDALPRPVTVHMIGNAHIDPVWLWPLAEGRAEVLSTYRTALMLLDAFEGYVFTSGGSVTYRWAAEDDPALFRRIQEAVASGRWALVNGWWLQPDCNIPAGESFARHALYGQRYLEEQFGRRARVGYNVDSFGHAGTLPQLLKGGGLDYYVFFRPGPHEKDLPLEPFWWESPDGTRVLTCRPPLHYGTPASEDMRERVAQAAARGPQTLPDILCFYGVGNHGGGPTRVNVETLTEMAREAEGAAAPRPVFSTPDRFFSAVEALGRPWPVVADDLQHHARGCYTALSRVKRENRQAEHALLTAERLAAVAHLVAGMPGRQAELQEAWEGVLFSQFHDILAGTSIMSAYEDVWELYDAARRTAERVQEEALTALEARLAPEPRPAAEERPASSAGTAIREGAQPIVVWNPLPWERTEPVRVRVPMGGFRDDRLGIRYPAGVAVRDAAGAAVPAQIVDVELDYATYMAHVEILATVPALGWRILNVEIPVGDPPAADPQPPAVDTLENDLLRLRFDPTTGDLVSLVDRATGREMLAEPTGALVIDDPSDTWSHDVEAFRDVIGRFRATEPPTVVADGPAGRTVRVQSAWGDSTLVQDYTVRPGRPGVDVTMTVDWHERLRMLKLALPLALENPRVTASAPYGCIGRGANGEEEPCQAWVDLSDDAGGLTLVNDSKYGYDALGGELRLSVLRSPIYAFHQPRQVVPGVTYHYTDQGTQTMRYRLLPHAGGWAATHPARADLELHTPLIGHLADDLEGAEPEGSMLRVEPEHVALVVAKVAEDGQGLLVRGYEAEGRPGRVVVSSEVLGRRWEGAVRAHEVWTWRLGPEGDARVATNLLEETP